MAGCRLAARAVAVCCCALLALGAGGCIRTLGESPSGTYLQRLMQSTRYDDDRGGFVNEIETERDFDFERSSSLLGRYLRGGADRTPPRTIPLAYFDAESFAARDDDGVRLTWVGHSTFLVEIDGVRVLTDPVWSERCSPVGFAGPRRFHPPGIPFERLPDIDAVIISHDHYDHLDTPTIARLAGRGVTFYVPLGVGGHLRRWGVAEEQIVELDWWQRAELRDERSGRTLELVATPARHFSGRGPMSRNETLWASWSLLGPRHRVFFGGDTGYFPGFRQIGERLGPFDMTLMPAGAYDPAWADVHMNPEEALLAHRDVGGRVLVPIHWGTFRLALHAWEAPPERLVAAVEALDEERRAQMSLKIPKPGQIVDASPGDRIAPWWKR